MESFLDGKVVLHCGDSREVLKSIPDNSIDSIVTDPPYALVSIVKRFGKEGAAPAKGNEAYMRASAGFMSRTWDVGDVAFSDEFWAECLRVLKPGGYVAAFGGDRTFHRLACAIEDAGFEIRHTIGWLFGSGFPKNHNISKDLTNTDWCDCENKDSDGQRSGNDMNICPCCGKPIRPRGLDGMGTALKPAMELISVARKPLSEKTVAANVLRWGTGAINVDGCRIEAAEGELKSGTYERAHADSIYNGETSGLTGSFEYDGSKGRWPANLVHDGSDEVVGMFPDAGGGNGESSFVYGIGGNGAYGGGGKGAMVASYADSGSAARFFYTAKAQARDRLGSKHPTVKPISLMQWLCRLITPPGGTTLDPFAGTGTTAEAAYLEGFNAVLIEREAEYQDDIRHRMNTMPMHSDERVAEHMKRRGKISTEHREGEFDLYGEN